MKPLKLGKGKMMVFNLCRGCRKTFTPTQADIDLHRKELGIEPLKETRDTPNGELMVRGVSDMEIQNTIEFCASCCGLR